MAVTQPDSASAASPEPETLEGLFCALESPLLQYALRYAGDRALAEDVVQEAFVKLHAQFEAVSQPRPWLYRTVHNLALNRRRDAGRTVSLDSFSENSENENAKSNSSAPETADAALPPDEQIIRLEGIGLVRISLQALDVRSREIVKLKFNDELSYKEIAARMNLTTGNVGFILHTALKTIAAELAKTGALP
jgi:RNA polymerase sigma factor (sigma-70 family)